MAPRRLPSDNRPNWQVSPYRRDLNVGMQAVAWILWPPLILLGVVAFFATVQYIWPMWLMFFGFFGLVSLFMLPALAKQKKEDRAALDNMIFKMKPMAQECVGEYLPDLQEYFGDMGVTLRVVNYDGTHYPVPDTSYMGTRINVNVLNDVVTRAWVG